MISKKFRTVSSSRPLIFHSLLLVKILDASIHKMAFLNEELPREHFSGERSFRESEGCQQSRWVPSVVSRCPPSVYKRIVITRSIISPGNLGIIRIVLIE